MKNELHKRYQSFDDEKLQLILTSKKHEYNEEATLVAKEILIERGISADIETLFLKKFNNYTDEDLISVVQIEKEEHQAVAITVAKKILEERDYEIVYEEEEEINEYRTNFTPLIIAVILLGFNIYMSSVIYEYNMTGKGPDFIISYVKEMGILHDIGLRLVVILLILHYVGKQKVGSPVLWGIGGLLFGAWALIPVGIIELFTPQRR